MTESANSVAAARLRLDELLKSLETQIDEGTPVAANQTLEELKLAFEPLSSKDLDALSTWFLSAISQKRIERFERYIAQKPASIFGKPEAITREINNTQQAAWRRVEMYALGIRDTVKNKRQDQGTSIPIHTPLKDPQPGSPTKENRELVAVAQMMSDLCAIVAEQQQQINELRQHIQAFSLAIVQTKVTEMASDHQRRLLIDSRDALCALGQNRGEIHVAAVSHSGSITVRVDSSEQLSNSSKERDSTSNTRVFNTSVELSGLIAKIGSIDFGSKIDVSLASSRLTESTHKSKTNTSYSFVGTFDVHHQGVTVKLG